ATVEACSHYAPVRPRGEVLHIAQHRLREKNALTKAGFPVAPYRHIRTPADLPAAVAELGYPCVLKTAGFGYDGKGQLKLTSPADITAAQAAFPDQEAVLEGWVEFEREVSVVGARGVDGSFVHYGVVE